MRVVNVRDETAYAAPGGRLTKVLADEATGAKNVLVCHAELPPGAQSDLHSRDQEEIIYVLEGEQVIQTPAGEEYRLGPGCLLFIPPGTLHQHTNPHGESVRFLGIFAPPAGLSRAIRSRPPAE
ncbi:MAG: cupin domain-containing protein [Nitrospinota bacterium]